MATTEEGTLAHPPVAIRDFQPEDYPAVVDIANLLFPDHTTTVSEERFHDERFDRGGFLRHRSVAVDAATDAVVGELSFNHMPWAFHPQRFSIWIAVHPQRHRQGIGRLLYARLMEELQGRRATTVRTWVQEPKADAVAWLARRGFRELHRSWESRLDVAAFDPLRFAEEAEVPPGIKVVTLADELKEDPERLRQVYEMDNDLAVDVPRVDPFTSPGFGMFRDFVLAGPHALPEAFFLAKDGDAYVGVSNLELVESLPGTINTGFTGVRREYRGRRIAMHLKLRAIDYAKRHGYRWIRTGNSSLNAPMLGINMKLGFIKEIVWITMGKDLSEA